MTYRRRRIIAQNSNSPTSNTGRLSENLTNVGLSDLGGYAFLDALGQNNVYGYTKDLAAKQAQELATEQARVDQVRQNVIPAAESIHEGQQSWTMKEEDALENWYETSYDMPSGSTPQEIAAELDRREALIPDNVKQWLPKRGGYSNQRLYNIQNIVPTSSTYRGLYCTPMGCFTYQQAGATDVPNVHSNQKFVRGVKEGTLPFERISPEEGEPGDVVLQWGMGSDYTGGNTRVYFKPHHTTIRASEDIKYTSKGTPYVDAYNAHGGDARNYKMSTIMQEPGPDGTIESGLLDHYRYVGQTPRLQRAADKSAAALQAFSSYQPNPSSINSLPATVVPNTLPQQTLQQPSPRLNVGAGATARRRRFNFGRR